MILNTLKNLSFGCCHVGISEEFVTCREQFDLELRDVRTFLIMHYLNRQCVKAVLLCTGEDQSFPSIKIWLEAIDANKVITLWEGQMVDPITFHKETDSDGWPQWPDMNQNSKAAPWTTVALPVNSSLNHSVIYII